MMSEAEFFAGITGRSPGAPANGKRIASISPGWQKCTPESFHSSHRELYPRWMPFAPRLKLHEIRESTPGTPGTRCSHCLSRNAVEASISTASPSLT